MANLLHPEPTPYDLNFRLFGTPVRVHPGFWCVHGCIGLFALPDHLVMLFAWVGIAFVSILVHEFGHVFAGRYFGAEGEIVLTVFGGLAGGSANLFHRWQRIIVYLAGPAAQLVFAGILWILFKTFIARFAAEQIVDEFMDTGDATARIDRWVSIMVPYIMLMGINIGWPLFNLLPIPPLDGGRVAEEIIESFRKGSGHEPWEQDPDWWRR